MLRLDGEVVQFIGVFLQVVQLFEILDQRTNDPLVELEQIADAEG